MKRFFTRWTKSIYNMPFDRHTIADCRPKKTTNRSVEICLRGGGGRKKVSKIKLMMKLNQFLGCTRLMSNGLEPLRYCWAWSFFPSSLPCGFPHVNCSKFHEVLFFKGSLSLSLSLSPSLYAASKGASRFVKGKNWQRQGSNKQSCQVWPFRGQKTNLSFF